MTPSTNWFVPGRHNVPPESAFPLHVPLPALICVFVALFAFSYLFYCKVIKKWK